MCVMVIGHNNPIPCWSKLYFCYWRDQNGAQIYLDQHLISNNSLVAYLLALL